MASSCFCYNPSKEATAMTKMILNSALRHQLPDLSQPFQVVDETGKPLGRFVPAEECAGTQMNPPLSREQIDNRKKNKGKTYTTEEVLAHLEQL
jgi:hypothetical protein